MIRETILADTNSRPFQVRRQIIHRIESGLLDLPLLPQVAHQILSLSTDPKSDAGQLASLLHQDQALAGHMLRVANSPAYMPRAPIVSLQQAVAWLGVSALVEMAVMISLQTGVFRVPGHEAEIRAMWRQALATGLYGKEIARSRRQNVERAFLCGLLHTIGKPVVLKLTVGIQHQLGIALSQEEIQALIHDLHPQVGIKMATSWHLPGPVIESMAYVDQGMSTPVGNKPVLITVAAGHFANFVLGISDLKEENLRSLPVLCELNLYPDDVSTLLEYGPTVLRTLDAMVL